MMSKRAKISAAAVALFLLLSSADSQVTPGPTSAGALVGYAASDLTAQVAALTTQSLSTPAATAFYRVSYYAKVTSVGSVSSVLGGTTGFVLNYTGGTDSVAQNVTLTASNQSGALVVIGTGNTTNTTATVSYGSTVVFAKTAVAMTYNFGYVSSGTAMQYEIHVRVEQL